MESLDYWRLCDELLTVVQAAMLMVGCDPSDHASYIESWAPEKRPKGYEAAKTATITALRNGEVKGYWAKAQLTHDLEAYLGPDTEGLIVEQSRIIVASLRDWLSKRRGVTTGFFFPEGGSRPDYLDPAHPRYAPKLAAAVKAWLALEHEPPAGLSPKKALDKWLRQHAADYDLSDEDGKPNETGIEEISKVANWRPSGGAPRTTSS